MCLLFPTQPSQVFFIIFIFDWGALKQMLINIMVVILFPAPGLLYNELCKSGSGYGSHAGQSTYLRSCQNYKVGIPLWEGIFHLSVLWMSGGENTHLGWEKSSLREVWRLRLVLICKYKISKLSIASAMNIFWDILESRTLRLSSGLFCPFCPKPQKT